MTETELSIAFEARKPTLTALGDWVVSIITGELEKQLGSMDAAQCFFQIPPKSRVKSTDSFLEKALIRKPKRDPLTEITDQVGVRFVVLLLEHIARIGEIITSDRWDFSKDRDHDAERLENPDYFAYQSDHYVIKTKTDIVFNGVKIPAHTPCEIQIRTILQHAYAEMAHKCDYKPSIKIPDHAQRRVKRSLAKGSALIETTDDVFREIQTHIHEYSKDINALLDSSSTLYKELTGEITNPATALGSLISDTYREQFKNLTPQLLRDWASSRPTLGITIKERRIKSVFYRDSVIIMVAWLIDEFQTTMPSLWPVDAIFLVDLYTALGVSTDGIL